MAEQNNYGAFVPTTSVWDVGPLIGIEVTSPQFKELLVRMYQNLNLMANVLNVKDTGYYDTDEYVCGQVYYPNPDYSSQTTLAPNFRAVSRIAVIMGQLPNAGTLVVPHRLSIDKASMGTRVYGTATDNTGLTFIPIPYSSTSSINDNIELYIDATNVTIITGSDRTNYNLCTVVIEYLKF